MVVYLLDISHHQGDFNIARAVGEGYSAVICKATEGSTYHDERFLGYITQVRAEAAIPGAYHFLRGGSGSGQARIFHQRVVAAGGPSGMLCACDNEQDATWETTRDFFAEWERLTGGHPLIMYSGAWWWIPRGWPGRTLTPYLWHSHYLIGTPNCGSSLYAKVPASWWTPGYGGWSTATLLQFSSSGQVAGKLVDVNAFRGSLEELRALSRHDGGAEMGKDMAGEIADWAAAHVENPATGQEVGLHVAAGEIWEGVEDLRSRPPAAISLTPEQLAQVRDGLAAEVAGLLAPQLRGVAQMAAGLAAAGDALATIGEEPQ